MVWVASEGAKTLTAERVVPDPAVVATYAVSGAPHNVTVAPDATVAATLPARGRLVLWRDGDTTDVELGTNPHDVKPAGQRLVVADEGAARLHILSPEGTRHGQVGLRANPHDLAVSPDGRWAGCR